MSYIVYYSDPAKNATPITISDGTKNSQSTSLTLIGRNYPGYGQAIAENLVHLLENFASPTPPNNPIEGQIWFDTSDPNNKKLRINDGGVSAARWSPINGIFQQPDEPTNVKPGDIWVDTARQQLSFYNGSNFTLVGPSYSSTTRTGSYPETVTDTLGVEHNVIIQYVNDTPIEIISTEDFTPNPVIEGFGTIEAGINVSNLNVGTNVEPNFPKINGIAESAYYLQLSVPTPQKVIADAFMRKDTDQRLTGTLSIASDGNALRIGTDPTFVLERRNQFNATFVNTYNNGRFTFEIAGSNRPVMIMDGASRQVTINDALTETAQSGLNVFGSIKATNSATFNTLYVMSSATDINQVPNNAIQVVGGVGIGGTLVVTAEHILRGPLVIGETQDPPTFPLNSATSILIPTLTSSYDIGDPALRWRNVYANVFQAGAGQVAQFVGIASSATSLVSPLMVSINGDINSNFMFRGNELTLSATSSATGTLITGKQPVTTTTGTDLLLLANPADNKLYKQTKRDFLKDANYYDVQNPIVNIGYSTPAGSFVPLGTILPYGGDVAPPGWLICDGSNINTDPKLQNLRNLIGRKYDPTDTNFLLPNLTGQLLAGAVPIKYIIKY